MTADIAISVQSVSKAFRIWDMPSARLTSPLWEQAARLLPTDAPLAHALRANATRHYHDFWALTDVSFEVRRGEAVGIIGRNGSGKSTLLQIIAGTLQPSHGTIQTRGRVAALLELGSGFNPEFSGRENVILGGAILGLSKATVMARFDQIAAYADIGEFIDRPVKTYSSGMVVRLAFALAAHVDADILIIDEALSVGDARFGLKCARTIDRFIDEGRTLLFVSHDSNSINRLCSAAVFLEQGAVQLVHSARTITNLYAKMVIDDRGLAAISEDLARARATPFERVRATLPPAGETSPIEAPPSTEELQARQLACAEAAPPNDESGREFSMGDGGVSIESIDLHGADHMPRRVFRTGEALRVRALIRACRDIPDPIFAVRIRNERAMDLYGTNTHFLRTPTPALVAGHWIEVWSEMQANFMAGRYFLSIGCSHFEAEKLIVHHRRYDAVEFTVLQDDYSFGVAQCHARITAHPLAVEAPGPAAATVALHPAPSQ